MDRIRIPNNHNPEHHDRNYYVLQKLDQQLFNQKTFCKSRINVTYILYVINGHLVYITKYKIS